MGGNRTAETPVGRGGRDPVDETLARGADQEREMEFLEPREMRNHRDALLGRLAETDAGIENDGLAGNAGARGKAERAGEKSLNVGKYVDLRIGGFAVVHDDQADAMAADDI